MAERRFNLEGPMRLAIAVAVWTAAIWIPRIFIIPVFAGWDATRLIGSLALGVLVPFALVRPGWFTRPLLVVFAFWSIGVWGRSLWNYWTLENPLGLRLVHSVLAAGFFYLAWRALAAARRDPIAGPDQGDSDQQGHGERTALSQG